MEENILKYKKIIMLTIVLAFLLAVSAISAADNDTSDVIGVEETTVDVVKETSNDVVISSNTIIFLFDIKA